MSFMSEHKHFQAYSSFCFDRVGWLQQHQINSGCVTGQHRLIRVADQPHWTRDAQIGILRDQTTAKIQILAAHPNHGPQRSITKIDRSRKLSRYIAGIQGHVLALRRDNEGRAASDVLDPCGQNHRLTHGH